MKGNRRPVDFSVTVTYVNVHGQTYTTVGAGRNHDDALAHADQKLPRGNWRRLVVSTPETILRDLWSDREKPYFRLYPQHGEGELVKRD